MIKPSLKSYIKPQKLSEYPVGTVYEAGHLVTKNAGWRTVRPVIDTDKCSGCLQCYMYCPGGMFSVCKRGKIAYSYDERKPFNRTSLEYLRRPEGFRFTA